MLVLKVKFIEWSNIMRFLIEIEGKTQPEVMHSLEAVREQMSLGGCYLNVCGCTNAILKPANEATRDQWYKLYDESHPKPQAAWVG
jgi:hypothetical protein